MREYWIVKSHHDGTKEVEEHINPTDFESMGKASISLQAYEDYIQAHGKHFTPDLAEHASGMMVNGNDMKHTWTTKQVIQSGAALGLVMPKNVTMGDVAYLANMYYADFFPDILKDEAACIRAAYKAVNDVDGYEGMIFNRWIADLKEKEVKLDWGKFV